MQMLYLLLHSVFNCKRRNINYLYWVIHCINFNLKITSRQEVGKCDMVVHQCHFFIYFTYMIIKGCPSIKYPTRKCKFFEEPSYLYCDCLQVHLSPPFRNFCSVVVSCLTKQIVRLNSVLGCAFNALLVVFHLFLYLCYIFL